MHAHACPPENRVSKPRDLRLVSVTPWFPLPLFHIYIYICVCIYIYLSIIIIIITLIIFVKVTCLVAGCLPPIFQVGSIPLLIFQRFSLTLTFFPCFSLECLLSIKDRALHIRLSRKKVSPLVFFGCFFIFSSNFFCKLIVWTSALTHTWVPWLSFSGAGQLRWIYKIPSRILIGLPGALCQPDAARLRSFDNS